MAYFSALGGTGGTSATITVTYSEDFYGLTITATNGTTTLTKTATSSGTLVFDVSEGGTWVVSGTVEGATYSESVDVTFEYTAPPLVALPDGSTALPVNDIQMWLKCAAIRDKTSYTTLSDVLGDTDTLIALCADSNACDYMARSTTWASGVAADSTAMLIVGKYNYCGNALLDDNTWATAIQNSPYSSYVDPEPAVYIPLVPVMTSNTTPSGECLASTTLTGNDAYKAFDGVADISDLYYPASGDTVANWYLAYKFDTPKVVNKCYIYGVHSANHWADVAVYGGNSISDLTRLSTDAFKINSATGIGGELTFENSTAYEYYALKVVACSDIYVHVSTRYALGIAMCQFYAKQKNTLIHSAVEDNIFYMDDGSPVALCGIPVGDTIDVDLEAYKGQTLTLVSTVAKDPTNLSNDFTMPVRITPNITEIYLMPLRSLYWYGNECGIDYTNSGYSVFSGAAASATKNKNKITVSQGSGVEGLGTPNLVRLTDFTTFSGIFNGMNIFANLQSGKDYNGNTVKFAIQTTALGDATISANISGYDELYLFMGKGPNSAVYGDIYALWLE